MIKIIKEHYMGEGIAKVVYRHPDDPSICIKFPNEKKKRALNDILREVYYLKKHQDKLPWLSSYLGEVKCDLGTGYMYEIVINEDGSPSQCIAKIDRKEHTKALLEKTSAIYFQLIAERAVVNDLSLSNIFFRTKLDGDFDLILIDGFGNNNFLRVADYSKHFFMKKLNRKFSKLCKNFGIPSDFMITK